MNGQEVYNEAGWCADSYSVNAVCLAQDLCATAAAPGTST